MKRRQLMCREVLGWCGGCRRPCQVCECERLRLEAVREELRRRLERKRARQAARVLSAQPAPRYDEVYAQGLEWMDSL